MADIKQWFMSIPVITRYWFGLSFVIPVLGRIGLFNPYHMFMTKDAIWKLELWRPFTGTFYYPIGPGTGFHYLINLYFLYQYSKNLETSEFVGKPADYLFMLIFNWSSLVLMAVFMNIYLLMDPLILSVLYVWCQLNKETIVSFWFGTRFKAQFLPWVLLGFNMILGGGGFFEILGILTGHLYYYVKYVYPRDQGGSELITTPSILYRFLPSYTPMRSTTGFLSFPTASSIRSQRNPFSSNNPSSSSSSSSTSSGHNWGGRGHVLGGN
ncbi:derlin 1 [Dermatophagoides pteronyssinus]|uniref:Derlin n=1 Tax=Dermatophagoides pteronyssinus TaxID=6956 RepID=A0A6P6YGY4_DERPT|nr:derlin-1-like [Dermatophagoides pteronyssinus]